MFVKVKLTRIKNVRSEYLFHDVNKTLNREIRTYGKQSKHRLTKWQFYSEKTRSKEELKSKYKITKTCSLQ